MGRPREHDSATRAELLKQAGEIIRDEGVAALSLRRLAKAASTSTRAIYSLFGGKTGLLSAIYEEVGEALSTLHEAVPPSDDPVEEILALAVAYRQGARLHPELYRMVFFGMAGFAPTAEQELRARRGYLRVLDAIERAKARGYFAGRAVNDAGRELWALVHGLASLELPGVLGDPDEAERLWRDAVTTMLRGFLSPADPNAVGYGLDDRNG